MSTSSPGRGVRPDGPDLADALDQTLDRAASRAVAGRAAAPRTVTGSRTQVWDAVTRLRSRTRQEILSVDDTTYLLAGHVPEPIQLRGPATHRAAIRRGVAVRQVTSRAGLLADRELGSIVYRAGGQARVLSAVPMKLSILDRRIALLPLDSAVLANGFRVIRDPAIVTALVGLYRTLWRSGADPAAESPPEDAAGPPEHLARLLPTLASGEPDEQAARRLGMSPRSYSRRVAELMSVLGARSRFQAGLEAARRGWL